MRLMTQDGRAFALQPGDNTIGRGLENAIVIPSLSMSRKHACLRWDSTGLYLLDVGSVNGTSVNGRRLAPNTWLSVQPGMQIQFGKEVVCQVVATSVPAGSRPAETPMARRDALASQPGSAPARPQPGAGRWQSGLDLLLRAVDVSLSKDKLVVASGGSLATGLLLLLSSLLAFRLLGESLVFGVLFVALGGVLAWLTISLMLGALTRMSHAELSGRQPVGAREAVQHAIRRWPQFALTPLALLAAVIVVGLVEVAVMLVGRIAYIGELVTSLLFLPALALNLFLVALLTFGSSLVFPIVVDRGRSVAGSLVYLYKLMRAAPARVVLYLGAGSVLTWLATAVLWGLVSGALAFTLQALAAGLGGAKFSALMLPDLSGFSGLIPGWGMLSGLNRFFGNSGFTYAIASRLFQLGALIALALALAFPLVLQVSLACAVYLSVREDVPA